MLAPVHHTCAPPRAAVAARGRPRSALFCCPKLSQPRPREHLCHANLLHSVARSLMWFLPAASA
eukprot:5345408-Pyramimonas_sp.AAC.1